MARSGAVSMFFRQAQARWKKAQPLVVVNEERTREAQPAAKDGSRRKRIRIIGDGTTDTVVLVDAAFRDSDFLGEQRGRCILCKTVGVAGEELLPVGEVVIYAHVALIDS